MAAPKKEGSVWRHRIMVRGQRVSGTFNTKAAALAWEAEQRIQIKEGKLAPTSKTLRDAFERYELEVSKKKRSYANESKRLAWFSTTALADKKIAEVKPADIAAWRDGRLQEVKGSTVNRDMNLLSHVFTVARREWGWLKESPTKDVERPKDPPHRDRRISDTEIDALCLQLGWDRQKPTAPATKQQRIAVAFLFAIETAMRAGEICALSKGDVHGRVARLHMTKNGRPRDVPLSAYALELWKLVPGGFDLTPAILDALFRKAKKNAGIEGLTFHDTRHEAITRLAQKLDVLDLARMVGHTNINQLRTYYNATAEDIASRLD
ncbi:site-specific integrase [Massilia sp. UMI-21]|nr:site-specific integrase [Massilia sp. UMI-21]